MSDVAAALVGMMRASELTLEDLAAYLEAEGAPGITTSAPTLRENAAKVLSGLKQGTAKDCRPHVRRLCEGELRQCSCTCVKRVERWATTGTCMCACTKCADAITFEGLGDRRLRPKSISSTELAQLPEVARRISAKRAVQHNLNRAKKGLAAKPSPGQGGQEMCATAVKKVFEMAVKDEHLNRTPAEDLEKGDRSEPRRTSLSDDQLIELFHVVVSGGDDPELDFDITWTEFETCFRRGGLLSLTVRRLMRERQGIEVLEKRNKTRIEPCSAELLDALFEMAAERGGTRCVPGRPDCDPNASVFYFKDSTPQHPHPLTDRRFDTLHGRIQRALPWANEALYSGHALRHTTSTMIDRIAGMRVAQKMLGHGPKRPGDHYTKASEEELATAWQIFSGRSHPSATPSQRP